MAQQAQSPSSDFTVVRSYRWLFFLTGFAQLALGLFAMVYAGVTTLAAMAVLGWALVVAGIVEAVQGFTVRRWNGFFAHVAGGVLLGVLGLLLATNPGIGAAAVTLIVGWFLIALGIFRIVSALAIPLVRRTWLLFGGVISIALGLLTLALWPASAVWLVGVYLGVHLVSNAFWFLGLAFDLGRGSRRPAAHQAV